MGALLNVTQEAIETIITEAKKQENIDNVKTYVMDPLIEYMFQKLYPYIVVTSVLFIVIFILTIAIAYMVLVQKFNKT